MICWNSQKIWIQTGFGAQKLNGRIWASYQTFLNFSVFYWRLTIDMSQNRCEVQRLTRVQQKNKDMGDNYMPGTILSTWHVLLHLISTRILWSLTTIPVLLIWNLRNRKSNEIHKITTQSWWSQYEAGCLFLESVLLTILLYCLS